MRASLWITICAVAAGCGAPGKPTGGTVPATDSAASAPVGAVAFKNLRGPDLINEYLGNRLAAEKKYDGKWVEIEARVNQIGRTKDGVAFIGTEGVSHREPTEPVLVFRFKKDQEASVEKAKVGTDVIITGRVVGYTKDGAYRVLPDYDFHITFGDCRLGATVR